MNRMLITINSAAESAHFVRGPQSVSLTVLSGKAETHMELLPISPGILVDTEVEQHDGETSTVDCEEVVSSPPVGSLLFPHVG